MEQLSLIGSETGRTEILLSLADEYWRLICEGAKPYEYRRIFRRDRTRAFIVTTGRASGLVGYLELGEPIVGPPRDIAALAESTRSGNGASVLEYLSDRAFGFAIPIEGVFVGPPIEMARLRREVGPLPVPQLYLVVQRNPPLATFLRSWMTECQRLEL